MFAIVSLCVTIGFGLLGFLDDRDTQSQIYIQKAIIRRKNAGELIVDGSITSDHISTNKISANKIKVDEINIGAAQITHLRIK